MFAKIFTQIFDSSIRELPAVRFTFMDMLVLADPNGVVDMTHEALAARTNRPIQEIRETILVLEGPDPKSRTPDNQGRRIVRLDEHRDWGWFIVNYERFRRTASEEQRREKTKLRTRNYRKNLSKTNSVTHGDAPVTHGDAGDAMQKQKQKQKQIAEAEIECVPDANPNFPKTEELALSLASLIPVPKEFILDTWHKANYRGGNDSKGNPIRNWGSFLRTEQKYERERIAKDKAKPQPNHYSRKPFASEIKTALAGVQRQIDEHPANRQSAYGISNPSPEQRVELTGLRDKLKALELQHADSVIPA